MKRSHLLALAGLLLLTILWVVLNGNRANERATVQPEAAQTTIAGAQPAQRPVADTQEAALSVDRNQALDNEDNASLEAESSSAPTFRVKVIHAATGVSIPHAEVLLLVFDDSTRLPFLERIKADGDQERALAELGMKYVTGADGVAVVPLPQNNIQIAARAEGLYGTVWGLDHRSLAEELEIRVAPVVHVRVHVEDETGVPLVGVQVGVLVGEAFEAQLSNGTFTDAQGNAVIRHLESTISTWWRGRRTRIVAMLPSPEPPGVEFNMESPPRELVHIVVPLTGSARVEVLDVDGKTVVDGTGVVLQGWPDAALIEERTNRGGPAGLGGVHQGFGAQIVETRNGWAHFPHVPLGIRLRSLCILDHGGAELTAEANGPMRPGEEVLLRLQQKADHPRLRMRIVDVMGTPQGNAKLDGTYWQGWPYRPGTQVSHQRITLDPAGHGSMLLEEAAVAVGTPRMLLLHRLQHEDSRVHTAWIFVPEQAPETGHDAGDVVLGGPIVVAGMVVDSVGAPIAGAWLSLRAELVPQGVPRSGALSIISPSRWKSDADGRFQFEGVVPGTDLHLDARTPEGGRTLTTRFDAGESALRLVLEPAGTIRGRLMLDPLVPGDLLWVNHRPSELGPDEEPRRGQTPVDRTSGEFEIRGLAVRAWDLEVECGIEDEPIARIPGVRVSGGTDADDPRLQVDLRGRLHAQRIVVLDPDGGRPSRLSIALASDDGWSSGTVPNPFDFLTQSASQRAWVSATGWGGSEIWLRGGETVVNLMRGVPVSILPAGDGWDTVAGPVQLTVMRSAADQPAKPRFHDSCMLSGGDEHRVVLPEAGLYALRVAIATPASGRPGRNVWTPLHFGEGSILEFRAEPTAGERQVLLTITAEMVREARERAARTER